MYVKTTIKKRKMRTSPLETGAEVGVQQVKEKDIVYDSEPFASSTLRGEGRSVMSRLFKDMAFLCTIYDVYFRNATQEHELGVAEDLGGKVDSFLADLRTTYEQFQKKIMRIRTCSAQTIRRTWPRSWVMS